MKIQFSSDRDPPPPRSRLLLDLRTLIIVTLLFSIPLSSLADSSGAFRIICVAFIALVATTASLWMRREIHRKSWYRVCVGMMMGIVLFSTGSILLTDLIVHRQDWGMLAVLPVVGAIPLSIIAAFGVWLVFLSLQQS